MEGARDAGRSDGSNEAAAAAKHHGLLTVRLLTLAECAKLLDPTGEAGIKASTLKGKLGTVRVGKRDLVPEPAFEEFCRDLERHAREKMERIRERDERLTAWKPPADTSPAQRSASVQQALATADRLKRCGKGKRIRGIREQG